MLAESAGITAMSLFNRYCAWRRTHPMSGGVMRVRRDRVDDYRSHCGRTCSASSWFRYRAAGNCRRRTAC